MKILLILLLQLIVSGIPKFGLEKPFKPFISAKFKDELKLVKEEEKYHFRNNNFKPFVSASPFQLSSKLTDAYSYFSEINFSVKCMFVDNYTLYNIAGLGANVLSNEIPEKGFPFHFNNTNTTIIYNFCHDLKESTECPYDKKQIFVKTKNGTDVSCKSYASSIGIGNKWYKGEVDGVSSLKIELNSNDDKRVIYILKCNEKMDSQKHEVIERLSYYDKKADDGKLETLLFIETVEACPKVDFYVVWKFVNDFDFIFSGLLILFGLFNCILGKRFAKFTSFLLTLFTATILFLIFSQFFLPSGCKYWIIWVMLAIGAIIGCSLGVFVFQYHDKVLAFLVGGLGGFLLGEFLFNLFGSLIPLNSILVNILFVVVCIIVAMIVAYFLRDAIIIGFTAFIGSYSLIRGISLFAGYFPSEFTVIDLKNRGEDEQLKNLLTWRVYIYLTAILISTGLSIFVQIKVNKFFKAKEDGPETPDDNLLDKSN
jgi:hypothetical protein